MKYYKVETEPWNMKESEKSFPWWVKLLKAIIPAANPDIEYLFDQANVWWVETDDEDQPTREIGFDPSGKPIVLAPIGHNHGFIVDNPKWTEYEKASEEVAQNFETTWNSILPTFQHLNNSKE